MKFTTFLIIMAGLQCASLTSAAECQKGWLLYNDSCYLPVREKVNWSAAWSYCRAFNSWLVNIDDAEENNFLKATLKGLQEGEKSMYWVGGTDIASEGEWVWTKSDNSFDFTNWGPVEPNNAQKFEDCLSLTSAKNFKWNDAPCDAFKMFFICEKPLQ